MADTQSPKAPRMRQARKSISHVPSAEVSVDKENATLDAGAMSAFTTKVKQTAKKSRSKSLGPGGLDALKEGTGNKGKPPLPHIKSILKPSIRLSPPKAIPPRNASSNKPPSRGDGPRTPDRSPKKSLGNAAAKDDIRSPESKSLERILESASKSSIEKDSPSKLPARVAVRTEEEQQAAAREKERQEMPAHNDARRKSLANRRVSFAPEATLHMWNVVELPEDSTTSSASTNSTRRASGLTASHGSPFNVPRSPIPASDASELPSTPPEQAEELQVAASPAHQRDLHQKRRRRSSTIPPMNFNDPNQLSSSPFSGDSGDDTETQAFETADEGIDSSDSDDKDLVEDETVTNIDADDNTFRSSDSTTSSGRLEAALEQAAKQAGTQGIEHDENGGITMEMADDEVDNAFKPWMTKEDIEPVGESSAMLDQENINPFSPAFKAQINRGAETQEDDGTMEMTQAVGGILPTSGVPQSSPKRRRRKSIAAPRKRRGSVSRRRSSGGESITGEDQTMELTTAIGGIQEALMQEEGESPDDDEELTMEFTSVMGGVVQPTGKDPVLANDGHIMGRKTGADDRRQSNGSVNGEEEMDFTLAAGGILLPSITERTEPLEDQSIQMDVTSAIGSILPQQSSTADKTEAKALMELETDVGQLSATSPFQDRSAQKLREAGLLDERPLPAQVRKAAMSSETGSPIPSTSHIHNMSRKSIGQRQSLTPKSRQPSPVTKPGTPSKQITPQPIRPTTPEKTPPSKNVTLRGVSPKKLFEAEIKSAKIEGKDATPQSELSGPLFHHDPMTGEPTPSVVLKPHKRRSSGLGIDREGLGSPRVTALLDRRGSIGTNAKAFIHDGRASANVRFEDPRILEQEIEEQRAQDLHRESGRSILKDEADSQDVEADKDATTNLKDMIESMTPQKKKLKGRKSLHVGTAKGLLGKRPAELDEEDEDGSSKRLMGREGSPVKNIKLPAPPSKAATTGRLTRSSRLSLAETAGNARVSTPVGDFSPSKQNTTPKEQPRFKDVEVGGSPKVTSFEERLVGVEEATEPTDEDDRIQLQDFLNMTGIRFMELTTTKRRHTVAPIALEQSAHDSALGKAAGQEDLANDLESRIVAAACTAPMLELYQHSCRELKNYISEGRRVAKEIEQAMFEDNPLLFREYMSAPPDIRPIMDNQFKNVRTNARLLSKAMWYEWRMKLLDGLKEGLTTISHGMEADAQSLTHQEQLLQPILPNLTTEHEDLERKVQVAQAQAEELASCDQEDLKEAREQLVDIQKDLETKRQLVEELQNQLREREDRLEEILACKPVYSRETEIAETTRQDCRGWSTQEVASLQAKVHELEKLHGWAIASANGLALSLTYDRTLQLSFTPSAFRPNSDEDGHYRSENAPISLTYIADADGHHPQPLTTEKRFFLQIVRAQLQCLQQSQTKPKDLLAFIGGSWDVACNMAKEVNALGVSYVTEPAIIADEVMVVHSVIFLKAMRTKVDVMFEIKVRSGEGVNHWTLNNKPTVRVCYGETLNEKKMSEFLESRIRGVQGYGVWNQVVKELEERLIARGRKA